MNLLSPKWIFLLTVSAGLTSCLDSPVAPSWTVKGTTALIDSKVSAIEIVKSSDSAVIDEKFQLFFIKSVKLKNIGVGDSIKIDEKGFDGEQVMDSLKIDAFESDPLTIRLSTLNPSLFPSDEFTGNIPAASFKVTDKDFLGLDEYEYAKLEPETTGHLQQIVVGVLNNFPFPVTLTLISLKDKLSGTVIVSQTLNRLIEPGSSRAVRIKIGGKTLTNKMQITFEATTTGANNVVVTSASGLDFNLSADELLATEAKGIIAGFSYVSIQEVDAGMDDFSPTRIEVKAGTLDYTVVNNSEMTGFATIKIPELKKNGIAYEGQLSIPPKSSATNKPNLAGYTITPSFPVADSPKLNLNVTFDLKKSTGFITVRKTDNLTYSAKIKSIEHQFAQGKIKERTEKSDPDTSEIKWPDDLKDVNLQFDKATITAKLASSLGIPAEVTPHVLFDQANKTTDSLTFASGVFPMKLTAATLSSPFIRLNKAIELSQINDFNKILNRKPEKIRYYVSATAAKGSLDNGFVYDTSAVKGNLELKIPIRFKSTTGYQKDSLYKVSAGTLTGMKSASLILDVQNKIPLKIGLNFAFVDSAKKTLVTYPKPDGTKTFYSLPVPPINAEGRSTGYGTEKIVIKLEESDFKLLEKAGYILLKYRIDTNESQGPSGGYSEVLTTDDLHIVMGADIQYKVNEE